MRKKMGLVRICLLVCVCLLLPAGTPAFANDQSEFRLQLEEAGDQLRVSLSVDNLEDMYSVEMNLIYDSLRLRLSSSKMLIDGFTLEPHTEGNKLRLVHTKTGNNKGEKGSVELAVLTFDRIRGGEASISMDNVKLVDSDLVRVDIKPDAQMIVPAEESRVQLNDIEGHWAAEAIREATELGFVTGYKTGDFLPERQVTRAEFAVMLTRGFLLSQDAPSEKTEFEDNDVIPAWAKPGISAAVKSGILNGYTDGTFRAERTITRVEMAAMIARALELRVVDGTRPDFRDADRIPTWAQPSVAAVQKAELMKGRGDNSFVPMASASRAEATTLILSALKAKSMQ